MPSFAGSIIPAYHHLVVCNSGLRNLGQSNFTLSRSSEGSVISASDLIITEIFLSHFQLSVITYMRLRLFILSIFIQGRPKG